MTFGYEKNDLMNTVGLAGEDWLDLDNLIVQACDLIKLFIGKKRQNRSNQVKIAKLFSIFQNMVLISIYKLQILAARYFMKSSPTKFLTLTLFTVWSV